MTNNARDSDDPEKRQSDEAALSARLRGLGDQLSQHRPSRPPETQRSQPAPNASGYARGFALSSHLVAGVLVGAAIGWALDSLLHIRPWGMIIFLLLGFAAGVVNVVRAVGDAPENHSGRPPDS
jgi:ATP synthase protein I